ncbi:hypothetical protein CA54_08790 [Symmachiella macrocystis]|uniref:Secreted protein n=1 Tax=Symmachiella macrocystis TaxID=2527985 RepID=A0A5C6BIR2_9PLAN|nr:hypothetical protein [Symmachiella macrocystis]TWU12063.1 hypothetical protein CA54_08790 [Symmachiella macrocystis]
MSAFRLQYVYLFVALATALPPMTCCADSTAAQQQRACCTVHDSQPLGDSDSAPVDRQCDCCLKRVAVTAEMVSLTQVDVQWQGALPPLAIILPATADLGGHENLLVAGETSLRILQCVWRI